MSASTSTAAPLPASPAAHAAAPAATPWRDKLNGVLFVGLMAAAVMQLADLPAIRHMGFSPLVVGIVCGMLYGNFARHHAGGLGRGRELHRPPVAAHRRGLYGPEHQHPADRGRGLPGLAVSVAVVLGTLLIGTVVGQRLLGLDRDTAMLTSAGSAISRRGRRAGLRAHLRSAPHKSAVAVATVVLFGTLSMFLYPVLYHAGWLNLDTQALGIYIGGTIHEVAQVGRGQQRGPGHHRSRHHRQDDPRALLVPVLLVLGMYLRNAASHAGGQGKGAKLPIPWFAIGFWRWPSSIR